MSDALHEAATLGGSIERLSKDVRGLTARSRQNRIAILFIIAGFLLDIVLTVVVVVLAHETSETSDRVAVQQTILRDKATCPVWQLFLKANTPQSQAAAVARGEDLEVRNRAFKIIQESYDELRCAETVR